MECLTSSDTLVRFLVTMVKEDEDKDVIDSITTSGEASKSNCFATYYSCMAEKRGLDRAILKLINAYELGLYSEDESDDFAKPIEITGKQRDFFHSLCRNLDSVNKKLCEYNEKEVYDSCFEKYTKKFEQSYNRTDVNKAFKGIQTRHWVVTLPKQNEHKNKDVKFTKTKAAWEDN